MPSTTATTLASNRRKLRLAQHNRVGSSNSPSPTPGAILSASVRNDTPEIDYAEDGNSPTPSPTLTVGSSSKGSHPSQSGEHVVIISPKSVAQDDLSPSERRRLLQNQQQQKSQHLQQQHNAPSQNNIIKQQQTQQQLKPSSRHDRQIAAPSTTTSRGRSRRSRTATRRGVGTNSTQASKGGGSDQLLLQSNNDILTNSNASDAGGTQQIMDVNHRTTRHSNNNDHPPSSTSTSSRNLALNLHVAESVDSDDDDNGTCFNSVGTTTPRQPSPRHVVQTNRNGSTHGSRNNVEGRKHEVVYQPSLQDDPNNNSRQLQLQQQQRLEPKPTYQKAARRTKTLSPLHENTSPSSSSQQQQRLTKKRGGSIWDHPEEMISHHHHHNVSVKDNMGMMTRDCNNSAYSEFDNDGNSYNNKHQQQQRGRTTNTTNNRSRGGGGGSIESRYDIEKEMMMENALSLSQQKKENGEEEGEEEMGMDAILNKPNMKAALGVGAAATLGGEFFHLSKFACFSLDTLFLRSYC